MGYLWVQAGSQACVQRSRDATSAEKGWENQKYIYTRHSIPTGCSNSYSGVSGGEIVKTRVKDDTDAAPQPGSLQAGQGCHRLASTPSGPSVLFQKLGSDNSH